MVNPWADDPALMAVNPAARVPAIVTDGGRHLTESLLILMRLEHTHPDPSFLAGDTDRIMEAAGIAYGVIEASVHTMVGRVIVGGSIADTGFDARPVGLRRRRTMLDGLGLLEAAPPVWEEGTPDLAAMTAVVAIDYVRFRFGAADWIRPFPRLEALSGRLAAERPAFASTRPFG